jgi:putative transposase
MTEISSDAQRLALSEALPVAVYASLSDVPPIFSFDEDDDYAEIFDEDDYAEIQEGEPDREANEIVTGPLSDEAQLKMEVIESLLASCDRKTYGQRLREAADKLGKSIRSIQRLVKKYEEQGISAITNTERSDKGSYRLSSDWQQFIINTYKQGNKGSRKMTPAQVAIRVEGRARELGLETYPSHMSVYRVLNPLIEQKEKKQKVRNVGWHGSQVSHQTRAGQTLEPRYSNHTWQCDHTKLDIMLVDQYGEPLARPWLTKITDSYSTCIMGIHLGFDAPSSQVVALALRHAVLPKQYGAEFKLHCQWATYGIPENLFTDGGKDFKSDHLRQIAFQLGFERHLRARPSEGGIEERGFGTINTDFLSGFWGYVGSNLQQRPESAEKDACLTLRELDQLLVRYITDNYNQRLSPKDRSQTRFQRWEGGLLARPTLMRERDLDICLMKKTRRTIYKGGYLNFENLRYRESYLEANEGDSVIVRYDPRDITTIWVYRLEKGKEVLVGAAHALDLETEQVSLEEAKAASRRVRQAAKTISNHTILSEVRDRDAFIEQKKKSRQQRKREEQELLQPVKPVSQRVEPEVESTSQDAKPQSQKPRVLDYDQLRRDYDW